MTEIELLNKEKNKLMDDKINYLNMIKNIEKEIENKVENWKGTSDTEVLLEAWNIWGTKTLEKIEIRWWIR